MMRSNRLAGRGRANVGIDLELYLARYHHHRSLFLLGCEGAYLLQQEELP